MLLSLLDTHVEALLSADGDGASDGQHLMHHPSQDVLVKLVRSRHKSCHLCLSARLCVCVCVCVCVCTLDAFWSLFYSHVLCLFWHILGLF